MKMIQVIDHQGNLCHQTYEKRAKGLIKKGRAHYVDAHTICLVCPSQTKEEPVMETTLTKEDIMNRLDKIINQNEYIKEAFSTIEKMPADMEQSINDMRVGAIMEVVSQREKTNREVIAFLERLSNENTVTIENPSL